MVLLNFETKSETLPEYILIFNDAVSSFISLSINSSLSIFFIFSFISSSFLDNVIVSEFISFTLFSLC